MKKKIALRNISLLLFALLSFTAYAQTGTISGVVTDKEFNNEPLPQANVLIKGTQKGTVTDFDGLFTIEKVDAGNYSLEVSFVGYETQTVPVKVEDGKTIKVNVSLAGSAVAMEEVVIKAAPTKRESETALLVQQKKAVEIKESIGAQQLAKLGVSDAAAATTKISGVTKSEGSGDVFVRGLGDRYLYTTLNGLPIPSDDVEKKNIDLGLFSTGLISSVDISKTTSSKISADQSSGNIDIKTKQMSGDDFLSIGLGTGSNTNIFSGDAFDNFKTSVNDQDLVLGFYNKRLETREAIQNQSWTPDKFSNPINKSLSFGYGKKITDNFKLLFSLGQSANFKYTEGVFRNYTLNLLTDNINDVKNWRKDVNTSGLLNLNLKLNEIGSLRAVTLLVNKSIDQVYEGGRTGDATSLDETPPGSGLFQFIRDQNIKTTFLLTEQILGDFKLGEKNKLDVGIGYNILNANEPNRVRNELNFNKNTGYTEFGRTGLFQQRKSEQLIKDREINARVNDQIIVFENTNDEDDYGQDFKINVGANYRHKTRDFKSQYFGATQVNQNTNPLNPQSIDDLDAAFSKENFTNGKLEQVELQEDLYDGTLQSVAVYTDFNVTLGKFFAQLGLRYQQDNIDVNFDVLNFLGRKGDVEKEYASLYPSMNLKYSINEKHNIRFSNSKTITLPEFKEIAPFEYSPALGQLTAGNPDIEASTNINYDLKWEFFPSRSQLISLTGFVKQINDPINKVMDRSAANRLSFFNSGEKAEIFGLETEMRLDLIKEDEDAETPKPTLQLNVNVSKMWHEQDLSEKFTDNGDLIVTYRYNGREKVGLQGASDWISNVSLNFNNKKEFPFNATLTGNYASSKLYSLGNPENQYSPDISYNEGIVEEGFVTLDMIFSKKINDKLSLKLITKNLLDPDIKRTQLVNPTPKDDAGEVKEDILTYKRGRQIGLSLNYKI